MRGGGAYIGYMIFISSFNWDICTTLIWDVLIRVDHSILRHELTGHPNITDFFSSVSVSQ